LKLNILSDIHNEFSVLPIPQTDADVVILAGDIDLGDRAIEWARQFKKPVIYLTGNHEYYKGHLETVDQRIREAAAGTNVSILDDELVIDDVRFIGGTLWTDFKLFSEAQAEFAKLDAQASMNDYRMIRTGPSYRKLNPNDTQALFHRTVALMEKRLKEPFSGKTVVITHHAPSFQSIAPVYRQDSLTPSFASNLEHLMGEPLCLWVHGHVHHSNDYVINGTRVVSNPRGYQHKDDPSPENREFKPDLIVEV
jgi:Icc-related predicted phosphoesterase